MHEHLNDDEAERLLSEEAGSDPLAATLGSMRHHFESVTPPTPSGALSEFVSTDLIAEFTDPATLPTPTLKDRKKMSISTFVGTAAGKILIGTSVAAASVGGAQATGVLDVPLLPDVSDESVVEVESPDIGEDTVIEIAAPPAPAAAVTPSAGDAGSADAATNGSDSASSSSSDSSNSDSSNSDSSISDSSSSDDSHDEDRNLVFAARVIDVADVGTVTIESDAVDGLTTRPTAGRSTSMTTTTTTPTKSRSSSATATTGSSSKPKSNTERCAFGSRIAAPTPSRRPGTTKPATRSPTRTPTTTPTRITTPTPTKIATSCSPPGSSMWPM